MSLHYKMIVPLLDENIKAEDFSKNSHFVDAYNSDINSPYLNNNIFLLYEYTADKESCLRNARFISSPYLYDSKVITINKRPYFLYTFSIVNNSIKRLRNNLSPINKEDLFKIYRFWDYKDSDINNYILTRNITTKFEDKSVPEIDWIPDEEDIFKTKKAGISI